ncbi:signal peptide peptidase SppA [Photobacterium jeanii]|uniref:Signal peptide peptidase SppA n=1 Tax=Photobacterium jeanii TaxID=858640 RepID=A0A178K8E5_9GAMM|nr:signal peptide peptidase SppA [Photobacterium jeanii]OAN13610.1 signal peptide peptidase SppA [Photobacterium jeanii]PST88728.1 signal peptide peptidase A [Photobacterium jeanii]
MKMLFKGIGKIFRILWKLLSFTRQLILNLFFLAFIGVIIFALTQSTEEPVDITKSALVLDLAGPIVEQRSIISPVDQLTSNALGQPPVQENVLFDIVDTIRHASTDNNITGLVLSLKHMEGANLTKLRYIAKAIKEFKEAGKPVYAFGDNFSQSQYYLASFADHVFMSPDGGVLLTGYGSYSLYYKSLLEKLDVNTHVFRVGTYKSFVEPYTRDSMSDAAREANTAWLNQLWGAYTQDVADNRQIDAASLTPDLDDFVKKLKAVNGDFAKLTLNMGLVDELVSRPQLHQKLIDAFGDDDNDSFNHISYYDYLPTVVSTDLPSDNKIAVVVASGAIVDGDGRQQGTIAGDTTAAMLRDARLDDSVKAVVLRVDSPGGSAFASEVIRNQVDALKQAGKPVVVSMSSLAASGGYWISSSADKIIAQPTTITGSIGIFAILTTFEKGLEKVGIYNDGVGTTPFAGVGVTRELPEGVAQVFQLGVEHGYQRFIGLVSQFRNMSLEQADHVAQGRVWTGKDALELGLVDQLGDFDDAITEAAKLAELENYELQWVKEQLSPAEQFLQNFTVKVNAHLNNVLWEQVPSALKPASQQVLTDLTTLSNFNDPKGQYAFCLNCINSEK